MTLPDAERLLLNLPPDHPLAEAVKALVADRDLWKRIAEVLAGPSVAKSGRKAGKGTKGSGA